MKLENAEVLITGGSKGVGLGLAKRFLENGSRVLITGRRIADLEMPRQKLRGLEILVSDVSDPVDREKLGAFVRLNMPGLNILVNNAGIQRRVSLADDQSPWSDRQKEIDILLSGPVHLNHLLVPGMVASGRRSWIINVTSGGAYIPQVFAPLYSACKAALHHYTLILRKSLENTTVRVLELIPPAVYTKLGGLDQTHGAPLDEFCDAVFIDFKRDTKDEIGFGPTKELKLELSGQDQKVLFQQNASRFQVRGY